MTDSTSRDPSADPTTQQLDPLAVRVVEGNPYDRVFYRLGIAPFLAVPLGWLIMLAVPLAHDVVGTPDLHPGYGSCLLLALLIEASAALLPTTIGSRR